MDATDATAADVVGPDGAIDASAMDVSGLDGILAGPHAPQPPPQWQQAELAPSVHGLSAAQAPAHQHDMTAGVQWAGSDRSGTAVSPSRVGARHQYTYEELMAIGQAVAARHEAPCGPIPFYLHREHQ